MNHIALHCSSFVGKHYGYHPDNKWRTCVQAASDFYRPIETFPARFEQLILHVKSLGFERMDVWQPGQLDWQWATPAHITAAHDLLAKHRMAVASLAGEFGKTRKQFIAACGVAKGIGAPILSGTTVLFGSDQDFVISSLKEYDLKLALENHPEKTAQEMLDQIPAGTEEWVGTAVDTGWYATRGYATRGYATRGYDVVRAIQELGQHVIHIHLKDVLPGPEHINCGYGKGIVPLEKCVRTLKKMGFNGDYSVENHNIDHDPDLELREGGRLVRQWLA